VTSIHPADLLPGQASRAVTFENPTGAPSAGGLAGDGRKGAPSRMLAPGERVVLADMAGPGTVTHLWLTVAGLRRDGLRHDPAFLRAQVLELFYDGLDQPSVSVPLPDLFGAVHGVGASYTSAVTAVNEQWGWATRAPMPFRERVRLEYENAGDLHALLYFQADVLLGPVPDERGLLHAAFRRDNPTTPGRDFVIAEGLRGPGRYLGCTGGVRVLDSRRWWGEGEVKIHLDGETTPTICGTGTEDYLDSAWGLGTFAAPESGAPLVAGPSDGDPASSHSLVSFYRWHLSDPVVFERDLRVTVQQIGYDNTSGLYERSDDWCATSFVYCAEPQPVPRVDLALATADVTGIPDGHRVVRRRQP